MGEEWFFLSEPLLPCSKVSPMFYDEIFQTRSVGGSFRASIQALPATTKPSQICWLYCIFLPPFIHPSIHPISSLLHSVLQTASHLSWNTLVWIPTVLPCIVFTASNRGLCLCSHSFRYKSDCSFHNGDILLQNRFPVVGWRHRFRILGWASYSLNLVLGQSDLECNEFILKLPNENLYSQASCTAGL